MIRFILFLILLYLLYKLVKNVFKLFFASPDNSQVKGNPKKHVRDFDPNEIEDIDYEEVKKKND